MRVQKWRITESEKQSKGVSQGETQALGKPQPMSPVERQRQLVI